MMMMMMMMMMMVEDSIATSISIQSKTTEKPGKKSLHDHSHT